MCASCCKVLFMKLSNKQVARTFNLVAGLSEYGIATIV